MRRILLRGALSNFHMKTAETFYEYSRVNKLFKRWRAWRETNLEPDQDTLHRVIQLGEMRRMRHSFGLWRSVSYYGHPWVTSIDEIHTNIVRISELNVDPRDGRKKIARCYLQDGSRICISRSDLTMHEAGLRLLQDWAKVQEREVQNKPATPVHTDSNPNKLRFIREEALRKQKAASNTGPAQLLEVHIDYAFPSWIGSPAAGTSNQDAQSLYTMVQETLDLAKSFGIMVRPTGSSIWPTVSLHTTELIPIEHRECMSERLFSLHTKALNLGCIAGQEPGSPVARPLSQALSSLLGHEHEADSGQHHPSPSAAQQSQGQLEAMTREIERGKQAARDPRQSEWDRMEPLPRQEHQQPKVVDPQVAALLAAMPQLAHLFDASKPSNNTTAVDALTRQMALFQDKMRQFEAADRGPRTTIFDGESEEFKRQLDQSVKIYDTQSRLGPEKEGRCLRPSCMAKVMPGAARCHVCMAPASVMDLRCEACNKYQPGTLDEIFNRNGCLFCFSPRLDSQTDPIERLKLAAKMAQLGTAAKYEDSPPASLLGAFSKQTRVSKAENDATMLIILGNDPSNVLIGAGASTVYEILQAVESACIGLPGHKLFPVPIDFQPTAKLMLGLLKPLSMGPTFENDPAWNCSITDILQCGGTFESMTSIVWNKSEIEASSPIFDFEAPEAMIKLTWALRSLTVAIRHTLGSELAKEHGQLIDSLLAAHVADGIPASDFDVFMVFLIHRISTAWWRKAMIAYVSKRNMSSFEPDLLYAHIDTAAMRPMLAVRWFKAGASHSSWADHISKAIFEPRDRAAKMQARMLSKDFLSSGLFQTPVPTQTPAQAATPAPAPIAAGLALKGYGAAPTMAQFAVKNPDAQAKTPIVWPPAVGSTWIPIPMTNPNSKVKAFCTWCLAAGHHTCDCTAPAAHAEAFLTRSKKPLWSILCLSKVLAVPDTGMADAYRKELVTMVRLSRAKAAAKVAKAAQPQGPLAQANGSQDQIEEIAVAGAHRRMAQWFNETPAALPDMNQPELAHLKASLKIGAVMPVPSINKTDAYPLLATRALEYEFPSKSGKPPHIFRATAGHHGEDLFTFRGVESMRCGFVTLGISASKDPSALFSNAYDNAEKLMGARNSILTKYVHLVGVDILQNFVERATTNAAAILEEDQPTTHFHLLTGWLKDLGSNPILIAFAKDGVPHFQLLLPASRRIPSPTPSTKVAHQLSEGRHMYTLVWNSGTMASSSHNQSSQPILQTLEEVLLFLGAVCMNAEVSIHLCVPIEDTLEGVLPVAPYYLSGAEQLTARLDASKDSSNPFISNGSMTLAAPTQSEAGEVFNHTLPHVVQRMVPDVPEHGAAEATVAAFLDSNLTELLISSPDDTTQALGLELSMLSRGTGMTDSQDLHVLDTIHKLEQAVEASGWKTAFSTLIRAALNLAASSKGAYQVMATWAIRIQGLASEWNTRSPAATSTIQPTQSLEGFNRLIRFVQTDCSTFKGHYQIMAWPSDYAVAAGMFNWHNLTKIAMRASYAKQMEEMAAGWRAKAHWTTVIRKIVCREAHTRNFSPLRGMADCTYPGALKSKVARAVHSGGQLFQNAIATLTGGISWRPGLISQHLQQGEQFALPEVPAEPHDSVEPADCRDCLLVLESTANSGAVEGIDDYHTHCSSCAAKRILPFSHLYSSQELPSRYRPCVMIDPRKDDPLVLFACGTKRVNSDRLMPFVEALVGVIDHRRKPGKLDRFGTLGIPESPPDECAHSLTLSNLGEPEQFEDSPEQEPVESSQQVDFDNRTLTQSPLDARQGNPSRSPLTKLKQSFLSRTNPTLHGVEDFYAWSERVQTKHSSRDAKRSRSPRSLRPNPTRTSRWKPDQSSPMAEELSSSVSDEEFQLAVGQRGPPALFNREQSQHQEQHFMNYLPQELRLASSKDIAEQAKSKTKQSTLSWAQETQAEAEESSTILAPQEQQANPPPEDLEIILSHTRLQAPGPLFESQGSPTLQDAQNLYEQDQLRDYYPSPEPQDQGFASNLPRINAWPPRSSMEVYLNRAAFENRPHGTYYDQEVIMSMRRFVEMVSVGREQSNSGQMHTDAQSHNSTSTYLLSEEPPPLFPTSRSTEVSEQMSHQYSDSDSDSSMPELEYIARPRGERQAGRQIRNALSQGDTRTARTLIDASRADHSSGHEVQSQIQVQHQQMISTNAVTRFPNQESDTVRTFRSPNAELETVILSSGPRVHDGSSIFVTLPMEAIMHESSDDEMPELVSDDSSTESEYSSDDDSQTSSDHFPCQCPWDAEGGGCNGSTSQVTCDDCSHTIFGCQCDCNSCKEGDRIRTAIRSLEYELHRHQGTISVVTWRRVSAIRRVDQIIKLRQMRASIRAMCEQYFRLGLERQP